MTKGLRRIDERVDETTHEIRSYEKNMVRRVQYSLKPCTEEELEILKTCFPEYLGKLGFKKLLPRAVVQEDSILYQCKNKPDLFFDVRKGTIHIPKKDFEKYNKAIQQNQAHFLVRKIRDCAEYYEIDYIEIHYLKRHLRYGMTPDYTDNPYAVGK